MAAPGADPVAKAVDKLKAQQAAAAAMEKARAQLGMMTKEQEKAARASDKAAAADARTAKASEKAAAAESKRNLAKMAKDQEKAAKEQQKAAKAADALAKANASIDFEPVTSPLEAFNKALHAAGPEGQAAAAAIAMWTAALTAAGAAIVKTIGFVTELVMGMTLLREQWMAFGKGGAAAGAATLAGVDALASKLPFAVDQVREWAKSLNMAKLGGKDLENAIKAVAGATAIMGEKGGAAAQKLIETLARGGFEAAGLVAKLRAGLPEAQSMLADIGLRVSDVADALGTTVKGMQRMRLSARQMAEAIEKALAKKSAGPLAAMMLTWPVLIAKVKEGFLSLFSKLGGPVKSFMKAVQGLFGEFGKGTPTMRKLQGIVTAVFTTVFAWGTKAVNAVREIVKSFQGSSQKGGVLVSIVRALGNVFKWTKTSLYPMIAIFKAIWGNALIMRGIVMIFKVIGAVVGTVIVVVAAFFGFIGAAVGNAIGILAALAGAFAGVIAAIVDGVNSLDLSAFVEKMAGWAQSGIQAFKSALGIASPSKVMMKMGVQTAEGAAQGIDKGGAKVEAAGAGLGDAAASGAAGTMGGAGGRGGKGVQVTIQQGAITIHAGGAVITDEGLASALERLLMAQGLGGR